MYIIFFSKNLFSVGSATLCFKSEVPLLLIFLMHSEKKFPHSWPSLMRLKSLFSLFDHYPEQSADLLSSISIWAFLSPFYLCSSITFLFGLLFYLFSFYKWISVSFSPDNLLFPVYTYLDFLQPKYHKQLDTPEEKAIIFSYRAYN